MQGGGGSGFVESLCTYGCIPANLAGVLPAGDALQLAPEVACRVGDLGYLTVMTSMFMHGGWGI